MARSLRIERRDGLHHVYARGNEKRAIFLDDRDRQTYLQLLGAEVSERHWHCLAYCLMHNHVHLVVETPQGGLGKGFQRVHGGYAQYFNRRHERVGHLFQGRFGSRLLDSDLHLRTAAVYVARNPVEAGICLEAAEWPWGSYAGYFEGRRPRWVSADRLLGYFGSDRDSALAEFAARVDRGLLDASAVATSPAEEASVSRVFVKGSDPG